MHVFTGVVEHHACTGVYVRQMLWKSAYTFASCSLQDVHMLYVYKCLYEYICIYICVCMYIHSYMYVCIYIYMHICMDVCICVCVCICVYIYIYMYMYVYIYIYMYLYIACMCSFFHLALGNEDGGVQLVYESAGCLGLGVILIEGKKGMLSVSSLFITRVGVYVGVCVCIRTHTRTLHRWGTWM